MGPSEDQRGLLRCHSEREWPHHEDVGYTDEPNKQGPAGRTEATFNDEENRPEKDTKVVNYQDLSTSS